MLNELEDFHFLLNYNGLSNLSLKELNTTIQLKCILNVPDTNTNRLNETVNYCYRRFQFFLFGFNVTALKYVPIATVRLADFTNETYNFLNTTISMPNNYTFASYLDPNQIESSWFFLLIFVFLLVLKEFYDHFKMRQFSERFCSL